MMRAKMTTHVGADGTLRLLMPTTLRETDVEVILEVEPLSAENHDAGKDTQHIIVDPTYALAPHAESEIKELL